LIVLAKRSQYQILELGFALGFGVAMTFTRALQIRRLARGLPADAHVLAELRGVGAHECIA
jgi:Tat protein secretion system quality control protein TatD with DNase activity